MSIASLAGKAQTVLGVIEGQDIGVTLPHEHVLMDGSALYTEPSASAEKGNAHKPVDWETLSWLH